MMRYVSKFFLEIFPSIVATVVGAYIVNHYISPRPAANAPRAAIYSKATPATDEDQGAIDVTPKAGAPAQAAKAGETEKPAEPAKEAAKAQSAKSEAAKSEAAKSEAVKAAAEAKRLASREKAIVRDMKPALAEPAPAITASVPEEHRDAAELARAAIERLRNTPDPARSADPAIRVQDAVREQPRDPVRVNVVAVSPPPVQPHPSYLQPLPPPVVVSAPGGQGTVGNGFDQNGFGQNGAGQQAPSSQASAGSPVRLPEAQRPIPPADIPQPPLDLVAATPVQKPSIADNMMSAARSVIHAVVPQ